MQPTKPQDLFSEEFSGAGWPDRFGEWISGWSKEQLERPIRTLSLFTGAGGLDIGFHQAGFHAVEMIEFDERFIPTLESNCGPNGLFGAARPRCEDVRAYHPEKLGEIDFIIGGPPCQSFSAAGRRAGGVSGANDERGQLFLAYVKLLKELQPRGFLFENVYGITGANGGRDWDNIREAFRSAGYTIFHRILDSADFGVPQHRERMFIVGLKQGQFRFPRPTHGPDSLGGIPHFNAALAIGGVRKKAGNDAITVNGRFGHLLPEIPPGLNYSFFTERMDHPRPLFAWRSKFSDFLYKADPLRPVRTIKAQGGQYTGPFHWDSRPFTLEELKRLQTFPDKYRIIGSRARVIQQIGNSVPPQVARILALAILEQLYEAELPFKLSLLDNEEDLGFRTRKRDQTTYYSNLAKNQVLDKVHSMREKIKSRTRYVILTEDFRMHNQTKSFETITMVFRALPDSWRFTAGHSNNDDEEVKFTIGIKPKSPREWSLPCREVVLEGKSLDASIFTALWKAFEEELQRNHLKADLIQLNGYYQYGSSLVTEMTVYGRKPWMWRTLAAVVAGRGIRTTLPAKDIAAEWGIVPERVGPFAVFLRTLGLEVRNHGTNPQIPEGNWLLPYSFPTLNFQSVQLRKELGK